jgi:hypothetical protein
MLKASYFLSEGLYLATLCFKTVVCSSQKLWAQEMDMFIVAKGVIMNLDRMPPADLLTIGIHSPGK